MPLIRAAGCLALAELRQAYLAGDFFLTPPEEGLPTLGDVPWFTLPQHSVAALPLEPAPAFPTWWPHPDAVQALLEEAFLDVPEALATGSPIQVLGRWVWVTWYTSLAAAAGLADPRPEEFLAPPPRLPPPRL